MYTLIACFGNALGLIMMKYSLDLEKPPWYKGKFLWSIGWLTLVMAGFSNVFSAAYGNLVLLASSGSITLLFNVLLSVAILKETFTKWDAIAMILICGGSITTMIVSKNEDSILSHEELIERFGSTPSIILYVFGVIFLFFAVFLYLRV
jgi:drug/metabolite transporter (DMT)-like permease